MSMSSARIVCTGCDYETIDVYSPILIRYQTASGKFIETGRAKGWCYNCSNYSDIEKMNHDQLYDELTSLKREWLKARHRHDELNRGLFSNFRHREEKKQLLGNIKWLNEEIADLGELLEIAKRRKSNARCLKCRSDRTVPIEFDSKDNIAHGFQHECGGNLQIIHDDSGLRASILLTTYILNEEGELLDQLIGEG